MPSLLRSCRDFLRRLATVLAFAVRAEPRAALLAFALSVLGNLSGPLMAFWLARMVNAVVAGDRRGALIEAATLALFWGLSVGAGHASNHVVYQVIEQVGTFGYQRFIELNGRIPTIEHQERPEFADRIELLRNELWSMGYAMGSILFAFGFVVRLAAGVAVLMSVDPLLSLLLLLGLPAMFANGWAQRREQRAKEESLESKRLSDHLFELTSTAGPGKEIRVFGLGEELVRQHRRLRRGIIEQLERAELRGALAASASLFLFGLAYAGAIVFVTVQAGRGEATVGEVFLVVALAGQVLGYITWMSRFLNELFTNLRFAHHYLWLRDYATRASAPPASRSPVPQRLEQGIRFEGVSFRYPDTEADVLSGIELSIPAGSTLALVGENGAGKTSLVKLLCGFYLPSEGQITVDGVDLSDLDVEEWRSRLSGGFQDFARFEFTARETVGLGDVARLEDAAFVAGALERASAADVIDHLPDGLESQLGKEYADGVELSLGQWQKLALGRAMMRETPLLLLLDEPTASLDAHTEHALFERYAKAASRVGAEAGAITVLVSHRFSTVRMADLIVVLEQGRIVEAGSHAELAGQAGLYAELYELQARAYR